jgi:hypothetical protein
MGDPAPRVEDDRWAIPPEAHFDRFKPDSMDDLMEIKIPIISNEAAYARIKNIIAVTYEFIQCVPTVIPLAGQDSPYPVVSRDEVNFRIKFIFDFFEITTGEWTALIRSLPPGPGAGLQSIAEIVIGIRERWERYKIDFLIKLKREVEAGRVPERKVPMILSAAALPPRTIEQTELDALKRSLELVLSAFKPPSRYLGVRLDEDRFEATRDGVDGVARFNKRMLAWNLFRKFVLRGEGRVPKEVITETWEDTDLQEVPDPRTVNQAFAELNKIIQVLSLKITASRGLGRTLVELPAPGKRGGGRSSPQQGQVKRPPGRKKNVKKAPRRRR